MSLGSIGTLLTGFGIILTAVDAVRKKPVRRTPKNNKMPAPGPRKLLRGLPAPTLSTHKIKDLNGRMKHILHLTQKGKRDAIVYRRSRMYLNEFDIAERDYQGELTAIYRGVRRDVRYRRDIYGIDSYQSARRTLELGSGDCDDISILLSSLYSSIGFPTKFKIIETKESVKLRRKKNEPNWDHIYVLVGLPPRAPRTWVPVDGSLKAKVGWEAPSRIVSRSITYNVD